MARVEIPQTIEGILEEGRRRHLLIPLSVTIPEKRYWDTFESFLTTAGFTTNLTVVDDGLIQATIETPLSHTEKLIGIGLARPERQDYQLNLLPIEEGEEGVSKTVVTRFNPPYISDEGERVVLYTQKTDSILPCLKGPAAEEIIRQSISREGLGSLPLWKRIASSTDRVKYKNVVARIKILIPILRASSHLQKDR